MHTVEPRFSADTYAMMTCAGISRQGMVEWRMARGRRRRVHIIPDPDAAKRKRLRRFLDRLTQAGILRNVQAVYLTDPLNTQDVRFLSHVPPAGIICWNGIICAKKTKGQNTQRTYALASFQPVRDLNMLSQFIKLDKVDPTILQTCQRELSTVYESLQKLQEANKIGYDRAFALKLEPIVRVLPESKKISQLGYVLACFAHPRGLVKLLPSAVRLALN